MGSEVNWKHDIIVGIISAIVGGVFVLVAELIPPTPPPLRPEDTRAEISSPKSDQFVDRIFVVDGKHWGIPKKYHLWMAVEAGGLLWPKEPEVRAADRGWSVKVDAGSPPRGVFSLVVFQVPAEGNATIVNWIASGTKTGDWPGIEANRVPGYSQLYVVQGLKLR